MLSQRIGDAGLRVRSETRVSAPAVFGISFFEEEGHMAEAYCVKCKAKKEMKDPQQVTMKNGKPAVSGSCPTCGTKMFRIGSGK